MRLRHHELKVLSAPLLRPCAYGSGAADMRRHVWRLKVLSAPLLRLCACGREQLRQGGGGTWHVWQSRQVWQSQQVWKSQKLWQSQQVWAAVRAIPHVFELHVFARWTFVRGAGGEGVGRVSVWQEQKV
eukprot:363828-Chlamydomonas_euryale.AAC.5